MLHIIDINIPDHTLWGRTFTQDVALPAKIHHIRGVLGSVLPDLNSQVKHDKEGEVEAAQIASFSLALNNTNVIVANSPLSVIYELRKNSYKHNVTHIDNIAITGGSLARVIIEEKHHLPFLTREEYDAMSENDKKVYQNFDKFTNGYTVKIFLDYD